MSVLAIDTRPETLACFDCAGKWRTWKIGELVVTPRGELDRIRMLFLHNAGAAPVTGALVLTPAAALNTMSWGPLHTLRAVSLAPRRLNRAPQGPVTPRVVPWCEIRAAWDRAASEALADHGNSIGSVDRFFALLSDADLAFFYAVWDAMPSGTGFDGVIGALRRADCTILPNVERS